MLAKEPIDPSGWVLIILAVPTTVLIIIGILKGYNIHFTKHRIIEKEQGQQDKDEEE